MALPAIVVLGRGCDPQPEVREATAAPTRPPATVTPTVNPWPSATPTATGAPTPVPAATATPAITPTPVSGVIRIGLSWPESVLTALVEAQALRGSTEGVELEVASLPTGTGDAPADFDVISVREPIRAMLAGDLIPIPDRSSADALHPALAGMYRNEDGLAAVPLAVSVASFAYRGDLFSEVGLDPEQPPTRWDDLASTARLLTRNEGGVVERAGLGLSLSANAADWLTFGWQTGGQVWPADGGGPVLDTGEFLAGARYFRSFFRDPPATFRREMLANDPLGTVFSAGLAAMEYCDFHAMKTRGGLPPALLEAVHLSSPPTRVSPVTAGGGRLLVGISAATRSVEGAAAAIARLLQPETVAAVTAAAGLAPSLTALQAELAEDDPRYGEYFRTLDFARDWRAWADPGVIGAARRATPRLALATDPIEGILAEATRQAREGPPRPEAD